MSKKNHQKNCAIFWTFLVLTLASLACSNQLALTPTSEAIASSTPQSNPDLFPFIQGTQTLVVHPTMTVSPTPFKLANKSPTPTSKPSETATVILPKTTPTSQFVACLTASQIKLMDILPSWAEIEYDGVFQSTCVWSRGPNPEAKFDPLDLRLPQGWQAIVHFSADAAGSYYFFAGPAGSNITLNGVLWYKLIQLTNKADWSTSSIQTMLQEFRFLKRKNVKALAFKSGNVDLKPLQCYVAASLTLQDLLNVVNPEGRLSEWTTPKTSSDPFIFTLHKGDGVTYRTLTVPFGGYFQIFDGTQYQIWSTGKVNLAAGELYCPLTYGKLSMQNLRP